MSDTRLIYRCQVRGRRHCRPAGQRGVVIAGGTDVIIKVREGKLAGCRLVSIHDLPELKGIELKRRGDVEIGPLSTFSGRDLLPR